MCARSNASLTPVNGRLEFLDVARAVAALAVLSFHYSSSWGHGPAFWTGVWNVGAFGVYTFFFVSGFVIPMSLQRYSLGQFWRSRLFRLWPAYLLVCAALWVLQQVHALPPQPELEHFHLVTLLSNVLMIGIFAHRPMLVHVSWTLALELVFYVLCSGLKASGILHRRLATAVTALLLYVLWFLAALVGVLPIKGFKGEWGAMLLAGFVGSVFYEVHASKRSARVLWGLVPSFLVFVLLAMRFSTRPGGSDRVFGGPLPASVAWLTATAFFAGLFALRRRSFPRPLLWIGRISFSLYLLHEVVGRLFTAWIKPTLGMDLLEIALAFGMAHLSYLLVERPSLRLARGPHRHEAV